MLAEKKARAQGPPIADHGLIGDLETTALISIDGTVDFLCWPSFDSPSVFASLLDPHRGGSFQLKPAMGEARYRQLYLPDSNILLTRVLSGAGVAEISDFMPVYGTGFGRGLVRRAKSVRGDIRFRLVCDPRFDYGRAEHRVERRKNEVVFISRGEDQTALRLRGTVPLRVQGGAAVAEFKLAAGETATFLLEDARHGSRAKDLTHLADAFKETMNFWQNWVRASNYQGRWREMVTRSALTLKLLTSARFGSIIAAPTFGLPEELGGVRNFDYRYTWIRDASFTLYALMRLGYVSEAASFMNWLEERCSESTPDAPLQIMYGFDGRHDLTEIELPNLRGYRHSRPVRVGNGAVGQLQLDIYGELMDSVYIFNKFGEPVSYDLWQNLSRMLDWLCANWRRPDEGVWEVRGGAHEFLYSRVMCWVALDRGIRLAQKRSFPAPLEKWVPIRDQIYRDVYENFWDRELKCFVQYKGAKTVDASSLLMPLVKFISPTDPRWRSTMQVINQNLVEDSLVYRYNILKGADTGFPGREGSFSMCSFWNVECLARSGDLKMARFYFDKALGYANHLGLFSEQLGLNGEQLGNFPQAFTHLGLVSAAYYLDHKLED